MRFARLVKAIECGTLFKKNGTTSQRAPQIITEASKKRKKRVLESNDGTANQNTLLKTDQIASDDEGFADDFEDGKIALGDKADDIPTAEKSMRPPAKKVAMSKSKTGTISDLASSGMSTSKHVESESELYSW